MKEPNNQIRDKPSIDNPVKPKILKKDKKGNYDIDGVSYCGNEITVAGENPESSEDNKSDESAKLKDETHHEDKMDENAEKLDRQKNLNYYAD